MSYHATGAVSQPVINCLIPPCPKSLPVSEPRPMGPAPAPTLSAVTPSTAPKTVMVLLALAGLGVFILMKRRS